ncbi:hypothetical protein FRC20_008129 [Serendipita sp. 405]|nr:hypothetical protein FRC15_008024 [Serendipita sp. 397]KAG8831420.1 hypothetical protein FRC20_008129 [Serendipita sp. 405]
MSYPSYDNCIFASKNVFDALEAVGETQCCLVGGMALRLNGIRRQVKDLDIVVLSSETDTETLKRALVEHEPDRFQLQHPFDSHGTSMKLYYRIPRTAHRIRIDLLLSTNPEVEIPDGMHQNHFVYLNGLATAPLYFLLYHKLLGWDRRINSSQQWQREKATDVDYHDVLRLCDILYRKGVKPLEKTHGGKTYLALFRKRSDAFGGRYEQAVARRFEKIGL